MLAGGRLHKIHQELAWEYPRGDWARPWRIHGERCDVTLTPFHGRRVTLDGLVGWAEEARNRW